MEKQTIGDYLELAVFIEKNGRLFYEQAAGTFRKDEELSRIFSRLAKDEKQHEEQFRKIIDGVPGAASVPSDILDEQMQYLRATSISRFFREGFKERIEEKVTTPEDALLQAFTFEKATLLFYGALKEVHGENDALDEIISAEKDHLLALLKVILTEARFRGLADSW